MVESEPLVVSNYHCGGTDLFVVNYPTHADLEVNFLTPLVVVEHGIPSDTDVFRKFLREVCEEECQLTGRWVELRGDVYGKFL